jgi:hypothetical protein
MGAREGRDGSVTTRLWGRARGEAIEAGGDGVWVGDDGADGEPSSPGTRRWAYQERCQLSECASTPRYRSMGDVTTLTGRGLAPAGLQTDSDLTVP